MAICSFCGNTIERGTGKMLIKTDGRIVWMCSTKCEKNLFKLKRKPREHKWTEEARKSKRTAGASKSKKE